MQPPTVKPGKPPKLNHDPSHDVLRSERQPMDAIFAPRSVAVIGATDKPGTVGRAILWNLMSSPFGGTLFPVNPKRANVLGVKAYPSIGAIPDKVDLAVIVTPGQTVPGIIGECIDAGVKGAIVISAGFKEFGEPGLALERQIQEQLKRGRLRVIGPNCLGVMNPVLGLNATFAGSMARPGNVAFVSQSGALCTAILDWSLREMVGFSAFVSTGSMLDVGWGDLIYYLGSDPHTHAIIIYMESIGDARSFLSAAREVAMTKPIIVVKAGRSEQASRAAASHTGALTGSDEVLDAAFRRCGALRVNNVSDLFYMAEVLSKQPRPKGPKLMIVSNAGGPGVLATDALIQAGGELAELSPDTIKKLDALLPPHWSHNNPIDILGDATPERYAAAMEIATADPNCDGLLFLTAPQGMNPPVVLAEKLQRFAKIPGKPVIASFMGGPAVAAADAILSSAGIPTFAFPDTAARAFYYMWRYSYNLRGIYETPSATGDFEPDRELAQRMIQGAHDAGRELLSEYESKRLLAAYGIPTVETRLALTAEEAIEVAGEIGYPVVLKLHSETITHKTDVGGIALNLKDADAVRAAFDGIRANVAARASAADFLGVSVQPMIAREGYELIIGSSVDSQFGPVLLFGSGGKLVEVYKDRALALPPLNTTLARRMMEQTKVYHALKGVRGEQPVDLVALEHLLVRFSQLVAEQRRIREIDINPLLASPSGLLALDARIVLHPASLSRDQLPKPAVRPYPNKYVYTWKMKDGTELTIRPIRPEDEPLMVKFHEKLSERSVYLRYFQPLKLSQRVAHERLTRICFIDYEREMALVAVRRLSEDESEIYGVGRLSRLPWRDEAEIAVLVRDEVQRKGLGRELTHRLVRIARDENVRHLSANILAENIEMQNLAENAGFQCHFDEEEGMVRAEMKL